MNKELGNRIRQIRIGKNFNPKDVADAVGILDTSYSKIEREGTNSVATLLKIAEVLQVEPAVFFSVSNHSTPTTIKNKNDYSFATKHDIYELGLLIRKLSKELIEFRDEVNLKLNTKPTPPKKGM